MRNKTIVVGLTGQTGAGKSTVSEIYTKKGIKIIDADKVAHEVMSKGTHCVVDIALEFGISVLNADGTLNRKKVADIVFSDKKKLKRFNTIVFPYIIKELEHRIETCKMMGHRVIILDAPTLFESKSDQFCDKIISVIAPIGVRRYRIIARDKLTEEQADRRIASQHDDAYYTQRSDYVIINDKDLDNLKETALQIISEIRASLL